VIVVSAIQSNGKENVGKENNKSSIFLSYIFLSAGRNDDQGFTFVIAGTARSEQWQMTNVIWLLVWLLRHYL